MQMPQTGTSSSPWVCLPCGPVRIPAHLPLYSEIVTLCYSLWCFLDILSLRCHLFSARQYFCGICHQSFTPNITFWHLLLVNNVVSRLLKHQHLRDVHACTTRWVTYSLAGDFPRLPAAQSHCSDGLVDLFHPSHPRSSSSSPPTSPHSHFPSSLKNDSCWAACLINVFKR